MENNTLLNSFDFEKLPALLATLTETHKPAWGKMTAQHMLEHLGNTLVIARSEKPLPIVTPEDKLPAYRQFLMSDKPFSQSIPNPFIGEGLPALRFENLETAKEKLQKALSGFHAYFAANPDAKPIHPFFGNLNYEEWQQFQRKHFNHHFRQFGLIE